MASRTPRADTDPPDRVSLTMWTSAHAETFVLTARTEVTDPMLTFGQRHLRTILAQYVAHHNGPRPPRPDHPVAGLSPGTDQTPAHPRRPPQRIREGRIKAKVSTSGRVLAPHRVSGSGASPSTDMRKAGPATRA